VRRSGPDDRVFAEEAHHASTHERVIRGARLAMAVIAEGQERFGTLTGRVTDQQNAAIPGVTVVTTNTESGEVRTFVTERGGRFTAPDLVPGRYTVRFELTGFSKVERPDVSVVLGRTFELDAQMRVGESPKSSR
jgi:hypothetical protein